MDEVAPMLRYDGKRINKRKRDKEEALYYTLHKFPFWRELFFEDHTEGDYYGMVSNHTVYCFESGFVTLPGDSLFETSYSDSQRGEIVWNDPSEKKNIWSNIDIRTLWAIVNKQIPTAAESSVLEYVNKMHEYAQKNPDITIEDVCSTTIILNEKSLINSMDRSLTAKSKKRKLTRKNLIKAAVC